MTKEVSYLRTLNEEAVIDSKKLLEERAAIKRQNEGLVTDLHRMNEELYQHWLALKDVRILG